MSRNRRKILWGLLIVPFVLLAAWLAHLYSTVRRPIPTYRPEPLRIAILDPLCRQLANAGQKGFARRDYTILGNLLGEQIGRPVELLYATRLGDEFRIDWTGTDLIVGRDTLVLPLAAKANQDIHPLLLLTDSQGQTDLFGAFVVRRRDPAKAIGDFEDHLILLGPRQEEHRHTVALATLAEQGVAVVPPFNIVADCNEALQAVAAGQADVAVISSYALPLLGRFGGPARGELRVVGQTTPTPLVTVYATAGVSPATEKAILAALSTVEGKPQLLEALDSKGFADLNSATAQEKSNPALGSTSEWTDWRGRNRTGISPEVPASLPPRVSFLWRRGLTGPGLSGLAATATHVIVADKSEQGDQDIWRSLDADTGQEVWTITYATPTKMQFTNAPRATPVLHGGFAYLLGAFGDLHCVAMHSHRIIWRRNIVEDFKAELPAWGICSTPLVVDDSLIVNPGAEDASVVALGLYTGDVLWKTPGGPTAPASFVLGIFGGVRQIVGYDAESLGGWDPNTGQRLWTLQPPQKGDYNVASPVNVDGRLLLATDNNGTRLYDFDEQGRIRPTPVAQNLELAPDMSTPVVLEGLVFGCAAGLHCLDLGDHLRALYSAEPEAAFRDYATFIGGNGRVLANTLSGELVLLKAAADGFQPISRLQIFGDAEVWSHPALVGDRLYIRSMNEVACVLLESPQ